MGRKLGATPLFGKAAWHPVELQRNNVTVVPRCRSIAGGKAGRDFSAGFSSLVVTVMAAMPAAVIAVMTAVMATVPDKDMTEPMAVAVAVAVMMLHLD